MQQADRHFLSLEGLSSQTLLQILDKANLFISKDAAVTTARILPLQLLPLPLLKGKKVVNLFFENSTRTRTTFEIAAKALSAEIINLNVETSSHSKGESLVDTMHTLEAMGADILVVRHQSSGAAYFMASYAKSSHIINAGDGQHAHPTQALLDMQTIRFYKKNFTNLRVAIIGDILHSRVARSDITALTILGCEDIRVIAPKTLLPEAIEQLGVYVYNNIDEGIKDADVIIVLRLQKERMQSGITSSSSFLPSGREFFEKFGLNEQRLALAKHDAIVMHPGPINRNIEIASSVADGKQSVILTQVQFGIAVRMAVMCHVLNKS